MNASPSLMNFRDLGGAPALGGVVAHGRLFRSAHLSDIDDEAATHLQSVLGMGVYLDFRTEVETTRDGQPRRLTQRGVRWHQHPFDISDAPFEAVRIPEARDWQSLYVRAVERLAPDLAGAIRIIAGQDVPLVFGCWAGKDRTGIVAGLVLSLLGVDDDWIALDYAKTAESLQAHQARFSFLWENEPDEKRALSRAHLSTDPQTMKGLLSTVRRRFGTIGNALQIPDATLGRLRARYIATS